MDLDPVLGLFCLAVLLGCFFWTRGIVRGREGDLVAGLVLYLSVCSVVLVMTRSSLSQLSAPTILFGLVVLLTSSLAKPDCPLDRSQRLAVGVGVCIVGLVLAVML